MRRRARLILWTKVLSVLILSTLKKHFISILFFNDDVGPAEAGWYATGNCFQYQVITTAQSWDASRRIRREKGGDLAAIGIRNVAMRSKL